ncbi:MAG TPA: replication initiator [Dermatophilaceae bacterium]|nr:replication initiator [Dermatophilaceae bacterium]
MPPSRPLLAPLVARLLSRDFDDWSEVLSRVGFCANPIRLVGRSETFDTTTGKPVRSHGSADEALEVTFTRCGDRRADQCQSCSQLYAADTFQQIRAGIAGGKTVPESVADNPLVFATLTASSFGPVHGTRPNGGRCGLAATSATAARTAAISGAGRPLRRRPAGGAAAVPGLLRLRLAGGVAVVGPGAVASVQHQPAPSTSWPPRGSAQ